MDANSIIKRWDKIRDDENCDLSLSPSSVAWYLSNRTESQVVRERIVESLIQFADYRLKNGFISTKPDKKGAMATCEGLEAFLIPAVEGASSFSEFLTKYGGMGKGEEKGKNKEAFVQAIKADILELLEQWEKGVFSGAPYSDAKRMELVIPPGIRGEFKNISITESAALACRVLIHILTLKLNRQPAEELFRNEIANDLDDERLFVALRQAIAFLVRAFQKGDGESEDERIIHAHVGTTVGSGWSWTDRVGLPPMLFFTAAAVDAFAELDLYLIRTALKKEWTGEGLKLAVFYDQNKETLNSFQLCIEMSRRWLQENVLPDLIDGYGQYVEKFPTQGADQVGEEMGYDKNPRDYENYQEDLDRLKELVHPPMVFYNSLYALQILLWSWGDRSEDGESIDEDAANRINRAISQLVYNYSSIPVVKEILNRFDYVFYLPGKGIFNPNSEKEREYLDSAFLPLLMRLLVLFVVYGVGDRNLLEPVIRNLYVELLQNRSRNRIEYSALWSTKEIEIFSTQRSIQALTFYYAYASGKELVEEKGGSGGIELRNKTGVRLVLEVSERKDETPPPASVGTAEAPEEPSKDPNRITEAKFADYCKRTPGWQVPGVSGSEAADVLQSNAKRLGETIISDYKAGKISDSGAVRLILNSVVHIYANPESKDGKVRDSELSLLTDQYRDLYARSEATAT
jgi:hypothetical protein